jgi:chromosome partitioning protein
LVKRRRPSIWQPLLAAIGERVLIVDLDPQGNASTGLGIQRRDRKLSSYDLMIGDRTDLLI